jgi:hypothetical protein
MEKEKLNPLQMVARELEEQTGVDVERIEKTLRDLLTFLHGRAVFEIDKDVHSDDAVSAAIQYRMVGEMIALFGTQLIAFEDMEDELPNGPSN